VNRPSLARRLARIRRNTRPVRVTVGPYSLVRRLRDAALGDHVCRHVVVPVRPNRMEK
jgi:hypothetical protein